MLLLLVASALLSLHKASAVPSLYVQKRPDVTKFEKPWFYHDLDGPEFKVVNHTAKFEERLYYKAKWASTNVESIFYSAATMTGFKRLFNYIQGANSKNVTIEMTVPVKVKVSPGQGPFCKNTFKVSFYVPKYKWDDIPAPKNPDVYIEESSEETVYVNSYGGYSLDPVLVVKAKSFIADLEAEGLPIDKTTFISASYDPPFRLTGRHNEIWIPKQDEESVKAIH
jgi:hypothetical protein